MNKKFIGDLRKDTVASKTKELADNIIKAEREELLKWLESRTDTEGYELLSLPRKESLELITSAYALAKKDDTSAFTFDYLIKKGYPVLRLTWVHVIIGGSFELKVETWND